MNGGATICKHGFLDVSLKDDYSNICEVLPHAQEIPRIGTEQQVDGEPWRFLTRHLDVSGRHVGWSMGPLHSEGTYGKIYKAHRMVVQRRDTGIFNVVEAAHSVVIKQTQPPAGSTVLPAEDVTAHTSEALLHVLAWYTIQNSATPWGIPRPYEVFGERSETVPGWRSMSFCMSYVRGKTLHSYFKKHWHPSTKAANGRMFLEIVAQVAYILWHLQQRLRLNHRDVKVNNILVRRRSTPVLLELSGTQISTHYEVTLIDFGFACVGCPPPRSPTSAFQSGSWFELGELCCKVGRDLAQLLFCIHCYFPFDVYLPEEIMTEVRGWLQIPWSGGTADAFHGFTREGRPRRASGTPAYDTGIYQFLRRPDVDPTACAPAAVFRAAALHLNSGAHKQG